MSSPIILFKRKPSLKKQYNFLSGLSSDWNFARASSGTYFDSDGLLKTAAIDTARIEHTYNGSSWSPAGLLMEGQATNYIGKSVISSGWSTYSASFSANQGTAPDGTNTAALFTGSGYFSKLYTLISSLTGSQVVSFSAFYKAGTAVRGTLEACKYGGGSGFVVAFDLSTESILNTSTMGTGTIQSYGILNVGNGWYFVYGVGIISTVDVDLTPGFSFYGGTGGTLYVWGAKVEYKNTTSSYIPTTSGAVTRALDQCYQTSPSWLTYNKGMIVSEFSIPGVRTDQTYSYILSLNDGTSNNEVFLALNTSGQFLIGSTASGVTTLSNTGAAVSYTAPNKVALAYDNTTGATLGSINGVTLSMGSLASVTLPSAAFSRIDLSGRPAGDANPVRMLHRDFKFYGDFPTQTVLNTRTA